MLLSKMNPDILEDETLEKIIFDIPRDDLERGDCIFVFGSRKHLEERTEKAVELYKKERAPKILFSGGFGQNGMYEEAKWMKEYAIKLGVPEKDIIVETNSNNTTENVLCSLVVLERNFLLQKIHRLLIVSSITHIRRCMLTLSRYMPKWIEYTYCYEENSPYNRENYKKDSLINENVKKAAKKVVWYAREGYIDDIDIL